MQSGRGPSSLSAACLTEEMELYTSADICCVMDKMRWCRVSKDSTLTSIAPWRHAVVCKTQKPTAALNFVLRCDDSAAPSKSYVSVSDEHTIYQCGFAQL